MLLVIGSCPGRTFISCMLLQFSEVICHERCQSLHAIISYNSYKSGIILSNVHFSKYVIDC